MERQERSFIVGGNEKGRATLEDKLVVSYKTKHVPTVQSDNHIPWYLQKWAENSCPHKNLHLDVHSSFIYNSPNSEETELYGTRCVGQLLYIQTMGCYSALKRNNLWNQEQAWLIQVKVANLMRLPAAGFSYRTFWKRTPWWPVDGARWVHRAQMCRTVEIFCLVMGNARCCTFVKTHRRKVWHQSEAQGKGL